MKRYKILYAAAVLATGGLCVASGRGILVIPLAFLLCAGGISVFFLSLASRNVAITFETRERCVVHKPLSVKVKMTVETHIPFGRTRVVLCFHNTLFDTHHRMELILQPGRASCVYEMPYTPPNCGRVSISMEQAVCYDLFGIVSKKITKTPDMEIVVYPVVRDFSIRKLRLPYSADASDQYDLFRHGQDVTEVFDIRDYREGDSLRSIHWKLSGKIDHLVVREFSNPTRYQTMLFYDSGFYGETPTGDDDRVMNAVLSMVASLSKNMTEQNLAHCVLSTSRRMTDETQVDSRSSFETMLTKLMCGRLSDAGRVQFDCFSEMGVFQRFSKIILVTGKIDQEALGGISKKSSITAIEMSCSGERRVERQGNLEIIRIPLEELEGNVHAIEI